MQVERKDGRCRACGGTVNVVAVDDATITVECQVCGDSYSVEPDALGDEAFVYFFDCLNAREAGDRKEVEHGSARHPQ